MYVHFLLLAGNWSRHSQANPGQIHHHLVLLPEILFFNHLRPFSLLNLALRLHKRIASVYSTDPSAYYNLLESLFQQPGRQMAMANLKSQVCMKNGEKSGPDREPNGSLTPLLRSATLLCTPYQPTRPGV